MSYGWSSTLHQIDEEREWQSAAACRGLDTEQFFPIDGERGPALARRELAAKQICRRCPVTSECLRWALLTPEQHGVWGGCTAEERRELRQTQPDAAMRAG